MTNERLCEIIKFQLLSTRLKFIRLRWAGHVVRMTSSRLPRCVLNGALEESTRTVGHPRLRWEDVLKCDMT